MFALSDDYAKFRDIVRHHYASFVFCPNQSYFQGAGSGYNMLSGKTMYYNAIKTDSIKAESCVTLANGSATPSTVLGRIASRQASRQNEGAQAKEHERGI